MLCTHRLDVDRGLWVLSRRVEMRPGLHGTRTRRERGSLLSYRDGRSEKMWHFTRVVDISSLPPCQQNLYNNITHMYPDSTIWVIGHSLGGALASLVGLTFGAPVVAFESPGEAMAARRLHLPTPVCSIVVVCVMLLSTLPRAALHPTHCSHLPHRRSHRDGYL